MDIKGQVLYLDWDIKYDCNNTFTNAIFVRTRAHTHYCPICMFRDFWAQCTSSVPSSSLVESQIFFVDFWQEDPNHNMCSRKNNKPSATCAAADGPVSVDSCPGWFAALWAEQKEWATRLLPKSQATWQIAVTHFPCGHEQGGLLCRGWKVGKRLMKIHWKVMQYRTF